MADPKGKMMRRAMNKEKLLYYFFLKKIVVLDELFGKKPNKNEKYEGVLETISFNQKKQIFRS